MTLHGRRFLLEILNFESEYSFKKPITLALGFFDSLHLAHREIIKQCKCLAKENDSYSAVFTFKNNHKSFLAKSSSFLVYDFETRSDILRGLGVDFLFYQTFDDNFSNISPQKFLERLSRLNVKAIVCGFDYTFGKNAQGTVDFLGSFCDKNSIKLMVVPQIFFDGNKVSTSSIKNYLLQGDLQNVNILLGESFRYVGKVTHGYKIGRKLGFATANIQLKEDLLLPRDGVYAGYVMVGETKYKAIINLGGRISFGDYKKTLEVHLLKFSEDLYGKKIIVFFEFFMRNQMRFDDIDDLSKQLEKDRYQAETTLK